MSNWTIVIKNIPTILENYPDKEIVEDFIGARYLFKVEIPESFFLI